MSYEYRGLGTNPILGPAEFIGYERPASEQPEEEGLIEKAGEWARRVFFYPEQPAPQQPVPMPGATQTGQPTADGFSAYAKEAALREGAAAEDEILPVQELPGDAPAEVEAQQRTWIERYQTHVTIASTVIGLATFGIWLLVRKKD